MEKQEVCEKCDNLFPEDVMTNIRKGKGTVRWCPGCVTKSKTVKDIASREAKSVLDADYQPEMLSPEEQRKRMEEIMKKEREGKQLLNESQG